MPRPNRLLRNSILGYWNRNILGSVSDLNTIYNFRSEFRNSLLNRGVRSLLAKGGCNL